VLPTLKPFKINPFENIVSLSLYLANAMTSAPRPYKAGPLTIALYSSNLRGYASGDSDYAADTQSDDSDSSFNCNSSVSGDEEIIAEARAAEAGTSEAGTSEAGTAEVGTAEAGTANPEERGNDKEAADEEVEPCGSDKWCECSFYVFYVTHGVFKAGHFADR